jgi:hypothetical protein
MYIVLLQGEIFCRHQLGPFHLWCHLVLGFLCWFFCLDDLSISDRGVLKSPITTVLEYICVFKFFSICLMKLGLLTLGANRLMIVISFCCITPFISMKWPSLSHLNNVSFWYKYCYSCLLLGDINLVNLLPAFCPKPVFISVNKVGLL